LDRLNAFGLGLASFGAAFSLLAHLLLYSVPLTALGIGALILGLSLYLTPTQPVPTAAVRALLEGAALGLEALLEEMDASARGYYIAHEDGRVYVHVPLVGTEPPESPKKPSGVVLEEDGRPFLVLLPPISELVKVEGPVDLESSLSEILVDLTEFADSVRAVRSGRSVIVEVRRPRGGVAAGRFVRVFGSIEASIAAAVAAASLRRPVYVASEAEEKGVKRITLRVIR